MALSDNLRLLLCSDSVFGNADVNVWHKKFANRVTTGVQLSGNCDMCHGMLYLKVTLREVPSQELAMYARSPTPPAPLLP